MNLIWHLIKYNIIFNKIRLLFLCLVSALIVFVSLYFYDDHKSIGESILQYCMYVFFVIFTGKMNAKNNLMFDIKQLQSMPMNREEIVFSKSVADIVHYLPVSISFLYGFYLLGTDYHMLFIVPFFFGIILVANIYSFNKRIDFSRMQHSSASFKNSFLFLHKYLGLGLQVVIVGSVAAVIFVGFKKKVLIQEFVAGVFIISVIIVMFNQTIKMLKDETLSFFIYKRDFFRIGWKAAVVGVPMLFFHLLYKDNIDLARFGVPQTLEATIKGKINEVSSIEDKKLLLAIVQNDEKKFDELLKNGIKVHWDTDILGGFPVHLAVTSGSYKIIDKLLELKPEEINRVGSKQGRTPIFSAIRNCDMKMIEHLANKGADLNKSDKNGNTPIIHAAMSRCHGGVIKLSSMEVNLDSLNKSNKTVFDYIKKGTGIGFILKQKQRSIASEISE